MLALCPVQWYDYTCIMLIIYIYVHFIPIDLALCHIHSTMLWLYIHTLCLSTYVYVHINAEQALIDTLTDVAAENSHVLSLLLDVKAEVLSIFCQILLLLSDNVCHHVILKAEFGLSCHFIEITSKLIFTYW